MKVVKVGSALWCRPIVPYGVIPHCRMVLAHIALWCRPKVAIIKVVKVDKSS